MVTLVTNIITNDKFIIDGNVTDFKHYQDDLQIPCNGLYDILRDHLKRSDVQLVSGGYYAVEI